MPHLAVGETRGNVVTDKSSKNPVKPQLPCGVLAWSDLGTLVELFPQ
jgi:hypothetical protein